MCVDGSQRISSQIGPQVFNLDRKASTPRLKHRAAGPRAGILNASRAQKATQMSLKLLLQVCGRGHLKGTFIQEKHPLQPSGEWPGQQQGDAGGRAGDTNTLPYLDQMG